jgi:hypothetical protein
MIPALLGNTIGGGFFVGTVYWYLFLTGEGEIAVDFNIGPVNTAIDEAGGTTIGMGRRKELEGSGSDRSATQLPDSGGYIKSEIGRDLGDRRFRRGREVRNGVDRV